MRSISSFLLIILCIASNSASEAKLQSNRSPLKEPKIVNILNLISYLICIIKDYIISANSARIYEIIESIGQGLSIMYTLSNALASVDGNIVINQNQLNTVLNAYKDMLTESNDFNSFLDRVKSSIMYSDSDPLKQFADVLVGIIFSLIKQMINTKFEPGFIDDMYVQALRPIMIGATIGPANSLQENPKEGKGFFAALNSELLSLTDEKRDLLIPKEDFHDVADLFNTADPDNNGKAYMFIQLIKGYLFKWFGELSKLDYETLTQWLQDPTIGNSTTPTPNQVIKLDPTDQIWDILTSKIATSNKVIQILRACKRSILIALANSLEEKFEEVNNGIDGIENIWGVQATSVVASKALKGNIISSEQFAEAFNGNNLFGALQKIASSAKTILPLQRLVSLGKGQINKAERENKPLFKLIFDSISDLYDKEYAARRYLEEARYAYIEYTNTLTAIKNLNSTSMMSAVATSLTAYMPVLKRNKDANNEAARNNSPQSVEKVMQAVEALYRISDSINSNVIKNPLEELNKDILANNNLQFEGNLDIEIMKAQNGQTKDVAHLNRLYQCKLQECRKTIYRACMCAVRTEVIENYKKCYNNLPSQKIQQKWVGSLIESLVNTEDRTQLANAVKLILGYLSPEEIIKVQSPWIKIKDVNTQTA